jgi:hypothetical protein
MTTRCLRDRQPRRAATAIDLPFASGGSRIARWEPRFVGGPIEGLRSHE